LEKRSAKGKRMSLGPWQVLLIAVVVLVLFGRGKIASLMGEVGKGITSFKKGIEEGKKEVEDQAAADAKDVTPEKDKDDA
jgi:sec-independent protein translocase protein TatA